LHRDKRGPVADAAKTRDSSTIVVDILDQFYVTIFA
jgi:hypothetical protein